MGSRRAAIMASAVPRTTTTTRPATASRVSHRCLRQNDPCCGFMEPLVTSMRPFRMLDSSPSMQETIENLVKLQTVELERARLAQALRALPAEVAQAEAALQAAQREVTAA